MKIKCRDENLYYMIGLMPVWLIIQKYGSKIEENKKIVEMILNA